MTQVYLSIIIASLLGSVHCAGMCLPLVVNFAQHKKYLLLYHFTRLMGYLTLTATTYLLGREFLLSLDIDHLRKFFAITFIAMGSLILVNIKLELGSAQLSHKLLAMLFKKKLSMTVFAALLGFFTFLLPCGWLYGYIIGSLTTESITESLIIISCFWLGTLPLMGFVPHLWKKTLLKHKKVAAILSGLILISIGCLKLFGIL